MKILIETPTQSCTAIVHSRYKNDKRLITHSKIFELASALGALLWPSTILLRLNFSISKMTSWLSAMVRRCVLLTSEPCFVWWSGDASSPGAIRPVAFRLRPADGRDPRLMSLMGRFAQVVWARRSTWGLNAIVLLLEVVDLRNENLNINYIGTIVATHCTHSFGIISSVHRFLQMRFGFIQTLIVEILYFGPQYDCIITR